MIITDRLGASAIVDAARPRDVVDAACEAAARACIRRVVQAGEDVGAFIRSDSVWVTRALSAIEPDRVEVRVEWSPDPGEGVELRGGPLDGEVVQTRRGTDGCPAVLLVFPQPPLDWHDLGAVPHPAIGYSYHRVGIDSEHDRWVYTHSP